MLTVGLFVRIEAKPDKVAEVEALLASVLEVIQGEAATPVWFALRMGPTSFGVFDAFADDTDRKAHLDANVEALRAASAELFAQPPTIEHIDVVAAKLPGA